MLKQQSNEDPTMCNICKLRCSSRKKLDTHMKSHTREDTYDMTLLQDAIKPASSTYPLNNCNKCKEEFKQKPELRKHIKLNHRNFKPCKNFSSGQRCDKRLDVFSDLFQEIFLILGFNFISCFVKFKDFLVNI